MSSLTRSFSDEKPDKTVDIDNEKAFAPELQRDGAARNTSIVSRTGEVINASGHRDQLQRQYGLFSICGLALTIDNAWVALGGSLTISLVNGGPPGVLYELLTSCVYYTFVGLSVAEVSVPKTHTTCYHHADLSIAVLCHSYCRWSLPLGHHHRRSSMG